MARPPDWQVVLRADAAPRGSMDRSRLQALVRQVLPAMADELDATAGAVIDGDSLPSGAGSKEYARIPSAWLQSPETECPGAQRDAPW